MSEITITLPDERSTELKEIAENLRVSPKESVVLL
jgi:hypothetical protein